MVEPIISLMDPEFEKDPVGALARLRETAPLVRIGFPGGPRVWLITRTEEIKAALSDPRFVTDMNKVPGHRGPSLAEQAAASFDLPKDLVAEFETYFLSNLMIQDGEGHARLRRLSAPAFAPRRIKALRPRIEEISARLIDALVRKGSGDLLMDYSTPLTSSVICELIGIDEADQPRIRKWMDEYVNADADFAKSLGGLFEYLKRLIEQRRAEPTEDLISTLVRTTEGDRLSEAEILALVAVLVNAGYHSTAHFIPKAVLTLLENPDQLSLLRAKPEVLPHAVEELMRITTVLPAAGPRYATEDMEFAGVSIRKGDAVTGSLQSANYDPNLFPDPERCDVQRVVKPGEGHLAFGAGPHRCFGAALANLEGEVAIDHLMVQRDSLEITVPHGSLRLRELVPGGAQMYHAFPVRL